jgi:hypothetical protein
MNKRAVGIGGRHVSEEYIVKVGRRHFYLV